MKSYCLLEKIIMWWWDIVERFEKVKPNCSMSEWVVDINQ